MIWKYKEGTLWAAESLLAALEIAGKLRSDSDRAPVISVVGAGGKTTTLHDLADEYARTGERVIVTTTTHIVDEGKEYFLLDPSVEKIRQSLGKFRQVWAGMPAPGGKLKGLEKPLFKEIVKWGLPVLIEADGARRMPLKVPAGHEPVIPQETTHVLSVYGLDAVGKSFREACFRTELACAILKKKDTDTVTAEDIAFLAASEQGGLKRCPKGAAYTVILNKADDPTRRELALEICRMLEKKGIRDMIVTSFADKPGGMARTEPAGKSGQEG